MGRPPSCFLCSPRCCRGRVNSLCRPSCGCCKCSSLRWRRSASTSKKLHNCNKSNVFYWVSRVTFSMKPLADYFHFQLIFSSYASWMATTVVPSNLQPKVHYGLKRWAEHEDFFHSWDPLFPGFSISEFRVQFRTWWICVSGGDLRSWSTYCNKTIVKHLRSTNSWGKYLALLLHAPLWAGGVTVDESAESCRRQNTNIELKDAKMFRTAQIICPRLHEQGCWGGCSTIYWPRAVTAKICTNVERDVVIVS